MDNDEEMLRELLGDAETLISDTDLQIAATHGCSDHLHFLMLAHIRRGTVELVGGIEGRLSLN